MPIIKPSKKFIGSDISNKSSTKYVKDGVQQVLFNSKENKDGAFLYFLPPFATDANGNGVWYYPFTIRDNFGDKFKEKYAVRPGGKDPVDHFQNNFKILYATDAKVVDEVDEKGQTRKRYPLYGRTTKRVIFNVAYVNALEKGNHILDLPSFMGASQITEWLDVRDARGKERPMLNDPERMIPVFVKLKDGGSGNPWQIMPDPTDVASIPDELADSDNLYNLYEDVLEYKTNEELIDKLRSMYASAVFDRCIEGFPGFDKVLVPGFGGNAEVPKVAPRSSSTAKVTPAIANIKPVIDDDDIPMDHPIEEVDADAPESPPVVSKEAAAKFLKRTKSVD